MKDRFIRGLVSGIIAGLVKNGLEITLVYALGFGTIWSLDFSASAIYGYKPSGLAEITFAVVVILVFDAILGVGFAYLTPVITSANYRLKGITYGLALWFAIYSIKVLFRGANLETIEFASAISQFVTSGLYGLVLAETLNRLSPAESSVR